MSCKNVLATLVAIVAVSTPAALQAQHTAADLTGTWNLEFSGPWGVSVWTFDLEQDGETLTGKSNPGMGMLLLEGLVRGHEIEFRVDLRDGPHALTLGFEGTVDPGEISGEVSFENGETGGWTLTRAEK